MDWKLDLEVLKTFLEECGTDGEKWESMFNNIPKEERLISFDFTCPIKKKRLNLKFNMIVNNVKITEA